MSKEYFDFWTKRFEKVSPEYTEHPREDYHFVSEKYPIFIVADGVTQKRDANGNYPNPSGVGEIARLFCEAVVTEAEKNYDNFTPEKLKKLFVFGNKVVAEYNNSKGRVKEKLDYRDFDFFACTTSFVLIKDEKVYWWSLNDSGIVVFNSTLDEVFRSPETWSLKETLLQNRGESSETEWNKSIKKVYRNSVGGSGYGVVTGEENALEHLNVGVMDLDIGSILMLYTDGFINYTHIYEFKKIFLDWAETIQSDLQEISAVRIKESPKLYGLERSLIAVKI